MSRLKSLASSAIYRGLLAMPESVVAGVEAKARLVQGKGGGAATVADEVSAGLSVLEPGRRSAPVVLDVGANVGDWADALLRAAPTASLTCFEPSSVAFSRLQERMVGRTNVSLLPVALGRAAGSAQLWSDQDGSGLASLTRRRLDHFGMDFSHSEMVVVETLDEWAQSAGVRPNLIKLDVEGHELDVLLSGRNTVSQSSVVQFEFGGCNIDTRTYFQDFFYFFKELDFGLFRLSPRGLVPIPEYRESDEAFDTSNFFAVSRRGNGLPNALDQTE